MLTDEQVKIIEKQCCYVPFFMNKSKALKKYLVKILLDLFLFIASCVIYKLNNNLFFLSVVSGGYLLIDSIIQGIRILQKQMINNIKDAIIVNKGVVIDREIRYLDGFYRLFNRVYNRETARQYYTALKVSVDNGAGQWYPCTNITYEHAVNGDNVVLLEFPEEYELGKYCLFLEADYIN